MTTYNAIEMLIKNKVLTTWDDAWKAIYNAYIGNKIDGYELEELAELAKNKMITENYGI